MTATRKTRPKPEREWFSPPEVAAKFGQRPESIIAAIRTGELPAANFAAKGRTRPRYRIHRDDLEAFIRRRAVVPAAKPAPRPRREAVGVTQYV